MCATKLLASMIGRAVLVGVLLLTGSVPGRVAAAGCKGSPPTAPACNTSRCTADGWTFWPMAEGTPCAGNGLCDGGIVLPNQVTPEAFGTCVAPKVLTPKFHLQSIIYMPPGALSSVSYEGASFEGSRSGTQKVSGSGAYAQVAIGGMGSSTGYSASVIDGSGLSLTKLDSYKRGELVATGLDQPVRGTDVFDVAANTLVKAYRSASNGWERNVWGTVGGAPLQVYSFPADVLLGNQFLQCDGPNQARCTFFATLTSSDKQAILSMNAPLVGEPLDPDRYQRVMMQYDALTLEGPVYLGASIPEDTYSVSYSSAYDQTNGSYVDVTGASSRSIDVSMIGATGAEVWHVRYLETRTTVTGAQKVASITLSTDSVGCAIELAVYVDALFGTYLVLPVSSSASCL